MLIDTNMLETAMGVITGKSPDSDEVLRPVTCTMRMLLSMLCISRSMVYEKINPKSRYYDPSFPKPFNLEGRRNYWLLREVHAYIAKMASKRRTGGAA